MEKEEASGYTAERVKAVRAYAKRTLPKHALYSYERALEAERLACKVLRSQPTLRTRPRLEAQVRILILLYYTLHPEVIDPGTKAGAERRVEIREQFDGDLVATLQLMSWAQRDSAFFPASMLVAAQFARQALWIMEMDLWMAELHAEEHHQSILRVRQHGRKELVHIFERLDEPFQVVARPYHEKLVRDLDNL